MAKKVISASGVSVLLFLAVIIFFGITTKGLTDPAAELNQADRYKEHGHYGQAEATYKAIIAECPGTDKALKAQEGLTIVYVLRNKQADADAALDRLLTDFSTNDYTATAVDHIAKAYHELQDYEKARQLYSYAVDNWPEVQDVIWSQKNVVLSSLLLADEQSADAAIDRLVTDFYGHADIVKVFNRIAEHCREVGNYEKALDLYQYVLANWPGDLEALWAQEGVVESNIVLGNEPNAAAGLDELLSGFSSHPELATAIRHIADRYKDCRKYAEARSLYEYVVSNWPDDPEAMEAQEGVASANILLGDELAAREALEELVAHFWQDDNVARAVDHVADTYRQSRKYEWAVEVYQYAITTWGQEAINSQAGLVKSYIALADEQACRAAVDKLTTDFAGSPNLPVALEDVVDALISSKDYEMANVVLGYLVDNWPDREQSLWSLAEMVTCNVRLGNIRAAQSIIDRMKADFSGYLSLPAALYETIESYEVARDYDQAKGICQQLIQEYPDSKYSLQAQLDIAKLDILSFVDSEQYGEAQKVLDQLIYDFNDYPGLSMTVFRLGKGYLRKASRCQDQGLRAEAETNYAEAIGVWDRVIDELPHSQATVLAYHLAADSYCWFGQLETALEYYQEIISYWPAYEYKWHAMYMVGHAYEQLRDLRAVPKLAANAQTKAAYEQLVKLYPNCPAAQAARNWLDYQPKCR